MTFEKSDFTPSGNYSDLVNRLIFEDGLYHPNLGGITTGGMANHFPMAVLSLAGLGAADNHINMFMRSWPRYRARIDDMSLKDKNILTLENWHEFLGRASLLVEFRRVFLAGLKQQGVAKFTVQTLHKMANGLPMGLFHPVIRLSFARMHGDLGIIADALAYFAIRYQDLYLTNVDDIPASTEAMKEPTMVWQTLSLSHSTGNIWITYEGASLSTCEKLCSDPDLHEWALSSGLAISAETLEGTIKEICEVAIRLYLFEPALTTLHAVTSAQALADLTRAFASEENTSLLVGLWKRYWIWLTGLFMEKGSPHSIFFIQETVPEKAPPWDNIARKATALNEVHAIKMLFTCKWLAEFVDDNPLYKQAATRLLIEHGVTFD